MAAITIPARAIDLEKMAITDAAEAARLAASGIRFAEFNEDAGMFRISRPIRTRQNLETGMVTVEQ